MKIRNNYRKSDIAEERCESCIHHYRVSSTGYTMCRLDPCRRIGRKDVCDAWEQNSKPDIQGRLS